MKVVNTLADFTDVLQVFKVNSLSLACPCKTNRLFSFQDRLTIKL